MKTAVSVPDDVFERAERLARRRKQSRSQLYSQALREYVARNDPDELREAIDRVCESVDTALDPAYDTVVEEVAERNPW